MAFSIVLPVLKQRIRNWHLVEPMVMVMMVVIIATQGIGRQQLIVCTAATALERVAAATERVECIVLSQLQIISANGIHAVATKTIQSDMQVVI